MVSGILQGCIWCIKLKYTTVHSVPLHRTGRTKLSWYIFDAVHLDYAFGALSCTIEHSQMLQI